jgi:NADPH:quinone reductase-like Zn-dependent oxidoreductase
MKAVELRGKPGIDSLTVVEKPDPVAGAGQVVVRVRAVSLNYRDLMMVTGVYNPKLGLPMVPCSDGAGEVAAVGPGVTSVRMGDRVMGTFFQQWEEGPPSEDKVRAALGGGGGVAGMLSELVLLSESGVIATPDHLSDEEAATLPCAALTAWNALFEGEPIRPGQTVLTLGTGGVSIFALQLAKAAGARVIVTSSSDKKLAKARAMGADEGINYKQTPDWEKRARELTGGKGVDRVIELGGAGTMARSMRAVRMGGMVSLIGVLSGPGGEVDPIKILMNSVRVRGIFVGSRAMFGAMNRAIGQTGMRPVIDRVFAMEQAREAWEYLKSGAHFGKVVVRVG